MNVNNIASYDQKKTEKKTTMRPPQEEVD